MHNMKKDSLFPGLYPHKNGVEDKQFASSTPKDFSTR